MNEPIPFLGWFEWIEEAEPLEAKQIMDLHRGWSEVISAEYFAIIVKQIEEYHGIR
jgi:hypothetical protein